MDAESAIVLDNVGIMDDEFGLWIIVGNGMIVTPLERGSFVVEVIQVLRRVEVLELLELLASTWL